MPDRLDQIVAAASRAPVQQMQRLPTDVDMQIGNVNTFNAVPCSQVFPIAGGASGRGNARMWIVGGLDKLEDFVGRLAPLMACESDIYADPEDRQIVAEAIVDFAWDLIVACRVKLESQAAQEAEENTNPPQGGEGTAETPVNSECDNVSQAA